jgi:hypothetical protein
MMRALVAALCLAIVAGCSAGGSPLPPTLSVPLPSNEWGDFTLAVYDETGLVLDGRAGDQSLGGASPASVTASPDRSELVISWTGGACSHRPIIRLTGDATDLQLVIVPTPAEFSLVPVSCPAVGILSSATLTLSQPVEQDLVDITEQR